MKQPEDYYTIDMFDEDIKKFQYEYIRRKIREHIEDAREKADQYKTKKVIVEQNTAVTIVKN